MTKLEELIGSKICFYDDPKRNCEKTFEKFNEIPSEDRYKDSKRLIITKNDNGIIYDSPYEKKILEDFDKCSFIKKIKTQSLVISYKPKLITRYYYPDIQLLLDDGIIAIIEVKPFKEMVNKRNLLKHEDEFKNRYCEVNHITSRKHKVEDEPGEIGYTLVLK